MFVYSKSISAKPPECLLKSCLIFWACLTIRPGNSIAATSCGTPAPNSTQYARSPARFEAPDSHLHNLHLTLVPQHAHSQLELRRWKRITHLEGSTPPCPVTQQTQMSMTESDQVKLPLVQSTLIMPEHWQLNRQNWELKQLASAGKLWMPNSKLHDRQTEGQNPAQNLMLAAPSHKTALSHSCPVCKGQPFNDAMLQHCAQPKFICVLWSYPGCKHLSQHNPGGECPNHWPRTVRATYNLSFCLLDRNASQKMSL